PRNAGAGECGLAVVFASGVGRAAFGLRHLLRIKGHRAPDDARHEYARQIDGLGRQFTDLDHLVDFDDGDLRRLGKSRAQVLAAAAELHIALTIRAIRTDKGVIDLDRGFHDVTAPNEFAQLLA